MEGKKQNKKAVQILVDHMAKKSKTKSRDINTSAAPDENVARQSLSYLDAFGYLSKELAQWKDISLGDIVAAIKKFQGMFGLAKSGNITPQTVRAMAMPRCGCPDFAQDHNNLKAIKDFVAANLAKWQKSAITYAITDYVGGISKTDFEATVYNAFQAWCQYGNINVQPTKTNQADIIISTGRGAQDNFDGPSGVLAWAYLPNGSDSQLTMKFDLDETWVMTPTARGILIANVACHELGHNLGLDHSKVQGALMAPYYNAAIAVPQANDDIPRFTARYGVRNTPTTPPAQPPVQPSAPGKTRITIEVNAPVTQATVVGIA